MIVCWECLRLFSCVGEEAGVGGGGLQQCPGDDLELKQQTALKAHWAFSRTIVPVVGEAKKR